MNTRVYIPVSAEFDADWTLIPTSLIWEDGTVYTNGWVLDIRQAHALKVGGQGDRYTVFIDGHQSYLLFERNGSMTRNNLGRWFVERWAA